MKTLDELEEALVKEAVEKIDATNGAKKTNDPNIKNILSIVEQFIKKKELICYGGTAINNILPEEAQFYDKKKEIPDYDFYSPNALDDAKELSDELYEEGYSDVEAKSGTHYGTYKVFVNFVAVADVTQMEVNLFQNIKSNTIKIDGMLYAPPNLLRMAMYLELSRPAGDVSRWEKVSKRLILLNKHYPLKSDKCFSNDTKMMPFQTPNNKKSPTRDQLDGTKNDVETKEVQLFRIIRNTFIEANLVFFGGYAISHYSRHLPYSDRDIFSQIPHFDVLSLDPESVSSKLKQRLMDNNFENIEITKHSGSGEIVPEHYEITVDGISVAFLYKPSACHSYNIITVKTKKIKIASIDTMLSFYLAMIYTNKPYYDVKRILCMCDYLLKIQLHNRLNQRGLLRRFGALCYGKQETLQDIKALKSEKFRQLKKSDSEYEKWFLKYSPMEHFEKRYNIKKKHMMTIKRSPNATISKSSAKNSAKSLSKSLSKSPAKSSVKKSVSKKKNNYFFNPFKMINL